MKFLNRIINKIKFNENDYNSFFNSIRNNDLNSVKVLVEKGIDTNIIDSNGSTPLLECIKFGGNDLFNYLLDSNANINLPGKDKTFPIHLICQNLDTEKLVIAFNNGVELNVQNNEGITPLMFSISGRLVIKGKPFLNFNIVKTTFITLLLTQNVDLELLHDSGHTALFLAAKLKNYEVVSILVRKGAEFQIKNSDGFDIFSTSILNGDIKIFSILIESSRVDLEDRYKHGETPLILAAISNKIEIVRLLVEHNVNLDSTTNHGLSAIMAAVSGNHYNIVKILIDAGANLNLKANSGLNAISVAKKSGFDNVYELLKNAGAEE